MVEKAAIALEPRETSTAAGSDTGQLVDHLGQLPVAIGHSAGVMGGQSEIDPVPDTGELGVMIDLLGMHRDARQEAERLREILEAEAPLQRLAVDAQGPFGRYIHVPCLRLAMRRCQAQMGAKGD